MSNYHILQGDCLQELKQIPDNFVDSIITDPPAGIAFMNKGWDKDKGGRDGWIEWLASVMVEAKRVLKPGGHAFVWAIPRTSHWTATALEDAGFEIRDIVTHVFGSGFPKSQNISKAIDKAAGAKREVVGKDPNYHSEGKRTGTAGYCGDRDTKNYQYTSEPGMLTAAATPEAKQHEGWGTALKPASEHWILCRKPLEEKTVAANVLKHGTGGINIDASRIKATDQALLDAAVKRMTGNKITGWKNTSSEGIQPESNQGRFPANFVMSHHEDCELLGTKVVKDKAGSKRSGGEAQQSGAGGLLGVGNHEGNGMRYGDETVPDYNCHPECPVKLLDEQSGNLHPSGNINKGLCKSSKSIFGIGEGEHSQTTDYKDKGGAARFFKTFTTSGDTQCQDPKDLKIVTTAEVNSKFINPQIVFALEVVLKRDDLEDKQLSDLINLTIRDLQQNSGLNGKNSIGQTQSIVERLLQELPLIVQNNPNLVNNVEMLEQIDITMTIVNHLMSVGFVDPAMLNITETNLVPGGKDFARFKYCAKPSKREKNAGIENREAVTVNDGREKDIDNAFQRGTTERKNTHPTVKSKKLMAYLITMITPPDGLVLDPFMGSGSTGIAALEKGFDFIGIEAEAEYLEIAEARLKHAMGE